MRRLRAFILHRTSVREQDRVIEALTREEGRIRVFAPGVRQVASRRAGHLEPFMETRLVVARSGRGDTVSEARTLRAFPRAREDLARLHFLFDMARLLREGTAEGQRDPALYDATLALAAAADAGASLPPFLLESAQVQVLRSLGAFPDVYRCTHCRKELRAGEFSLRSSRRGFWCRNCGGRPDLPLTDAVKLFRLFLRHPVPAASLVVSESTARCLKDVLTALVRAHATAAPRATPVPLSTR